MRRHLTSLAKNIQRTGGADENPPAGVCIGVHTPATGTVLAAAGWAERPTETAPGERLDSSALFDLASVSKIAATTALAMRLTTAGLLDLDAPVHRHLTGFRGGDKDLVTAADLLAHRSGLIAWWPLYCATTDREQALDLAEGLPLGHRRGERRVYSDVGFQLLGRLVERLTNSSIAEAFKTWVAAPLGLTRTGYGPVDPARAAACADGDQIERAMVADGIPYPVPFTPADFTGWRTTTVRGRAADGNAHHALGGAAGHAGLFAPLEELLLLGAALARDEEFVPATVRARFTAAASPDEPSQGLGFRRFELPTPHGPVPMIGHEGFTGTHLSAATDRPLVVAMAATRLHGATGARADLLSVADLAHDTRRGIVQALELKAALPAPSRSAGFGTTPQAQESP
ncbi:serine hydrolase domain-containing protein [Streptomyces rochei]|uniref:serine hydrolase domain-containing protein n=1 Tax=Streptomyces rochei TaxID=1928 RepID=UPI0033CC4DEC